MTIRSITAAVAVAFAGLSTAAFAEPKPPVTLAAVAIPAASSSSTGASDDGRRICVKEVLTGSTAPRKQCRTRAEWSELGLDISARK